jgi:hypothetical protein
MYLQHSLPFFADYKLDILILLHNYLIAICKHSVSFVRPIINNWRDVEIEVILRLLVGLNGDRR